MPTQVEKTEETEADRVMKWRLDQLTRAGIRKEEALELAKSHSDLHQMVDAKDQGCDVAVLCRIFSDDEQRQEEEDVLLEEH